MYDFGGLVNKAKAHGMGWRQARGCPSQIVTTNLTSKRRGVRPTIRRSLRLEMRRVRTRQKVFLGLVILQITMLV